MQAAGGWTPGRTQSTETSVDDRCQKQSKEQQDSFPRALAKEQLRKLKAKNFPGTLEEARGRNDEAMKAATGFSGSGLRLEEFQTQGYQLRARG